MGVPVAYSQLQPGDLVFFDGLGHVGIYIGGGQFIHSPHTGDVVKISSLAEAYYAGSYVGAPPHPLATVPIRVQLVDLGGEVLLDDPSLQLQGRRDLALLGGEVAREDAEALDLLVA